MTGSGSYLKTQVSSKLSAHCHFLTYQSQSIIYTQWGCRSRRMCFLNWAQSFVVSGWTGKEENMSLCASLHRRAHWAQWVYHSVPGYTLEYLQLFFVFRPSLEGSKSINGRVPTLYLLIYFSHFNLSFDAFPTRNYMLFNKLIATMGVQSKLEKQNLLGKLFALTPTQQWFQQMVCWSV